MAPAFLTSLNLVFLGPPGAGKGTQARILAERYRIPHIATGDLLRGEVQRRTPIGQQVEEAMAGGRLVSDQLVSGLVVPRLHLDGAARGFILDGYPRNLTQAGLLDGILAELNRNLERVLLFNVDDQEVVSRLAATRGKGSEPSLRRRLEAWREDEFFLAFLNGRVGVLVACPQAQRLEDESGELLRILADRLLRLDPSWRLDEKGRGLFFGSPRLDTVVIPRPGDEGMP